MPSELAAYPAQSQKLISAGRYFLETLSDSEADPGIAIKDLEVAASPLADSRLRFAAAPGGTAAAEAAAFSNLQDALAAAMLELQSANLLMSAGIAKNEHGAGANDKPLRVTLADISTTRTSVQTGATFGFAASSKPSATLEEAAALFRTNAGKALDAITDGTVSIINSAAEQLKKMDGAKVLEAIDRLGQSFEVGAAAGRLIRQGIEKLKAVLDALSGLFSPEAFAAIKAKVQEIWKKIVSNEYTKAAVRWMLDADDLQQQAEKIAASSNVTIASLDTASRGLAMLDDDYQRLLNVLNGIVAAITVAMGILALLHMLGPYLALAGGFAYVCVLGAAILAGMSYTGSGLTIGTAPRVCTLIESAQQGSH
jgi:hypothetical protein